jgi:hypothetical protein
MNTVTHLIASDIVQTQNNELLVRFALPNEFMNSKPFTKAVSSFDIERRRLFLTRNYMVEKLCAWLRQRTYALPAYRKDIASILNWFECYQKTSIENIVSFVNRHIRAFYAIAPDQRSRTYNHYAATIEPILNYCKAQQSA